MRIIKPTTLRRFWEANPRAEQELLGWVQIVDRVHWKSPADVKRSFGARVDFVKVKSGKTVAVFDIAGNHYRLIAAIHYDYPRVFVLRIFDHAEYDRNYWKSEL